VSEVRILPLGGLGEIGKNMTVVEKDGAIVVVDTGLMFPTSEMLGIDLVLPDFTGLRGRDSDICAIVLTHGHEDHVGALPFVLREIFGSDATRMPPIYGGALTIGLVRSKLEEHRIRDAPLEVLAPSTRKALGPFELEFVHMAHSIPDSRAVVVRTDLGPILVTGDYKFDQTPVDGNPADVSRLAALGAEGLLCLCGDSTNADRPGIAPSESSVGPALLDLFARCRGRIIVTSFASNVHRVQQVIDAAAQLDRKVALVGRSMRKNFNIARNLGIADAPEEILISPPTWGWPTRPRGSSSSRRRSRTSRTTR
jgi:ribonuclease J